MTQPPPRSSTARRRTPASSATPGAEWLELLCKHIPDRYEHLNLPVPEQTNDIDLKNVLSEYARKELFQRMHLTEK